MSASCTLDSVDAFIGDSHFANSIRVQVRKIAPHSSSVLITGPSGTGKELIARAIHALSPRAERPFIAVDCASVPGPLFAAHLFGHVKGAFTGAEYGAQGCFRAAEGGSVFLDEIGDLNRESQGNLLRVLQERVVAPLGTHTTVPVDVRIIVATNCDLAQLVAGGHFRQDLYYRLNVVALKTIPLKDRPEDVVPLAQYFLTKFSSRRGTAPKELAPRCLECMLRHDWPGNVRELSNFMERAVTLASDSATWPDTDSDSANRVSICPLGASLGCRQEAECLPPSDAVAAWAPTAPLAATESTVPWPTLAQLERDHIQRTLERTGYNQRAAADLLGIHRQQLLRKIKKYGLDTSASHPGRPHKQGPR